MSTIVGKGSRKVDVTVKVGSGVNEYRVCVVAWLDPGGNIQVQLAPEKNGSATEEETALRMLQRDPSSVLRQVNKALHASGVTGVAADAELVEAKVVPGPNVPLHKNDPRITPDFLATLVVAARSGYGSDYEVEHFVKHIFNLAGVTIPDEAMLVPFTSDELEAAEQLDGTAPTIDGVLPQVVSPEIH